jgi:hypothetical protein
MINFGHPSGDWPLGALLSFRNRSASAVTVGPSSSSVYKGVIDKYLQVLLCPYSKGKLVTMTTKALKGNKNKTICTCWDKGRKKNQHTANIIT